MPELTLNLTEAESLKPIPDGTYPGVVHAFGDVTAGPKAKYISAILKISDERVLATPAKALPIEGKGAGIFVDFINKITGNNYDVDDHEALEVDTDDLIGSPCGMVLKQEEYPEGSGDFRSQVKRTLKAE